MNVTSSATQTYPQLQSVIERDRFALKISGESGQGINSIGEIFAKLFKRHGYGIFGYREYPSLIKGGYSSFQLDISDHTINSSSAQCDILACLNRQSLHAYLPTVREKGLVLYIFPRIDLTPAEKTLVAERQLQLVYVPALDLAYQNGGSYIMANTVLTGIIAQLLPLDFKMVQEIFAAEFSKKPALLEKNLNCLQVGYDYAIEGVKPWDITFTTTADHADDYLLTGNHALALGAVAAGVRAYYGYPMTPTSSVLTYLAATAHQTGMLVKQIEDEISVAQMAIGSMFMGTRALCGTSGGGFDLMTESLSLAGMTETPFVCILGQRPGPATGLPTWTATGDLLLAAYAGHGEFPRLVIAASDPTTAYTLMQHAFNLAEKFQIPVIILTEKQIAEALFAINAFPAALTIERHLPTMEQLAQMKSTDRYDTTTESGVSPRWLPGQSDETFDGNGDEHLPDGSLTESAEPVQAMFDKRMRKIPALAAALPEPELYGPEDAEITFVSWGSVKNAVLDAQTALQKISEVDKQKYPTFNYLHYEYMFPIKTKRFLALTKSAKRLVLIENNGTAQLGTMLSQATGYQFADVVLKSDGRPFFIEDILTYLRSLTEKEVRL
jgi:2-oxoglutarate/2-oxoacid ferredoxin oxidoreductase subunit alpha